MYPQNISPETHSEREMISGIIALSSVGLFEEVFHFGL